MDRPDASDRPQRTRRPKRSLSQSPERRPREDGAKSGSSSRSSGAGSGSEESPPWKGAVPKAAKLARVGDAEKAPATASASMPGEEELPPPYRTICHMYARTGDVVWAKFKRRRQMWWPSRIEDPFAVGLESCPQTGATASLLVRYLGRDTRAWLLDEEIQPFQDNLDTHVRNGLHADGFPSALDEACSLTGIRRPTLEDLAGREDYPGVIVGRQRVDETDEFEYLMQNPSTLEYFWRSYRECPEGMVARYEADLPPELRTKDGFLVRTRGNGTAR